MELIKSAPLSLDSYRTTILLKIITFDVSLCTAAQESFVRKVFLKFS